MIRNLVLIATAPFLVSIASYASSPEVYECSAYVASSITGRIVSVGNQFRQVAVTVDGPAVQFDPAVDPRATIQMSYSRNGSQQTFVRALVPSLATDLNLAASTGSLRIGSSSTLGLAGFTLACEKKN